MPPYPPAPSQTAGPPCGSAKQANLRVLLDDVGRGIRHRINSSLCDSIDWDPSTTNGSRLKKAVIDAVYSFYTNGTRHFSEELPFSNMANLDSEHNFSDEEIWPMFQQDAIDEEILPVQLLSPRLESPCNAEEDKASSDNAHETAVSKGLNLPAFRDVGICCPLSAESSNSAFNSACVGQHTDTAEEVNVQIALTSDGFRGQGIRPFSAPLDYMLSAESVSIYIRRHWKHQASDRIQPSHLNLFDKMLGMYNQWTNPISVSSLNILPDGRRLLQIEIIGLDLNSVNVSPVLGIRPYSTSRRKSRQSVTPFKQRRESRNFDDMILI